MTRQFIDIDPEELMTSQFKNEDFFTEAALNVLSQAEFAGVVRVESDRILVSDIDFNGTWLQYNGEKLRAEQIESILHSADWMLPEEFEQIADDERLLKYDLQPLSEGFYYPNHYFPVTDAIKTIEFLSGVKCNYYPQDDAFIIFPSFE